MLEEASTHRTAILCWLTDSDGQSLDATQTKECEVEGGVSILLL
jgi:hypothetical protein